MSRSFDLFARPRGWVVPLLARTPAGLRSRLLLAAAIIVPFIALALRALITDAPWYTPEVGLTVIVVVNVFFGASIVLGVGVILHKRETERARLASIVESSADAIIVKSREGVIENWNRAAEQMYGYRAAEAIGRSITMLVPPELHDEVQLLLERVRRGERIDPFETVRVAKDGRRIDVWLSVSPVLDDDGTVVGASSIARDITQRKQEQEALRRSEELLRAAQRAGRIGHFCWDIQNNINTWSDELVALYGLPPGSFEGQHESWRKRIFPDDLPAADAQIRDSLSSGEFSCDFRVVWPDASIHWMHASAKVLFSDDGKPLRMVGVNMDITERKRAEEALRATQEQLLLFIGQAPTNIAMFDREMCCLAASRRWAAEYGRGLTELVGRSHYEINPDLPERWKEIHRRALAGETLRNDDDLWVKADGTRNWLRWAVVPWRDARGEIGGIIMSGEDITERKRAEEALERERQTAQHYLDIAGVMIIVIDRSQNVLLANKKTCEVLACEESDLIGNNWFDIAVPEEERGRLKAGFGDLMTGKIAPWEYVENSVLTRRGEVRLIAWRNTLLRDETGGVIASLSSGEDITERKQAEEAVQLARERLQTLSRRLLEIQETERRKAARELHDEIGQALTAIKITLQSLQRYPEPAAIADRLGESVGIVERALGQVRSLSLELRPPLLDDLGLGPALRWLVNHHAGRAELGVDFRNSVADARFDTAVETACFRVAQEALNNVVRHAGARHVTVELHLQNDGLHLRVSDDGAGFDVPDAHRRAAQGASLGLLGMEERAALAGGGIEWRSAPGEGAVVHAWFPLPRPAGTNDETAATA